MSTVFHTITAVSNFLTSTVVDAFDAQAFHGIAEREGIEYPHDRTVWASNDDVPLYITRTGGSIPRVFCPSSHLIVSEQVRVQFQTLPHIRFSQVRFKRLVDMDRLKEDIDGARKRGYVDTSDILKALPDVPAFHETVGMYYELQTWRLKDVLSRYNRLREITIETGTPPLEEPKVIVISAPLLKAFPIVNFGGGVLLDETAYGVLKGHLDPHFFLTRRYEMQ